MTRFFSHAELAAILSGSLLALLMVVYTPLVIAAWHMPALLTFVMVVWISWRDIDAFLIPDGPVIALAVVGLAERLVAAGAGMPFEAWMPFVDAALCGGMIFLLREIYYRMRGVDGIGFGDVKLSAAAGVFVGTETFAWALFIASVSGIAFMIFAARLKGGKPFDRLPFGAFLAPACWSLWLLNGGVQA